MNNIVLKLGLIQRRTFFMMDSMPLMCVGYSVVAPADGNIINSVLLRWGIYCIAHCELSE